MESERVKQTVAGIQLTGTPTFSLPAYPKWQAKLHSAIGYGKNVYLSCHTDDDFSLSQTSVHVDGEYTDAALARMQIAPHATAKER